MLFNRTFKNIRRAREIVRILFKYGFEDIISETNLRNLVSEKRQISWIRGERPVLEYSRWERVRMAAEELGPTFIKFAQILANRPDILPDGLIKEFESLQSNVPPFDVEVAKSIIEQELGIVMDDFFDYFEEKPIGAASIGQVHFARLKTGEEVVIKVQRPNVRNQIETDLSILTSLAEQTVELMERMGVINLMDVIKAFERSMQKELDYKNEARNIEQFRNYYKNNKDFYVPRAYKQYTTQRVMIIERVYGCKITALGQLNAWGVDPDKIAALGMRIYLTQIFEHGYFHADPHPGNVLVTPQGGIILIDFGMVGSLMEEDKHNFADVFISMAQKNAKGMARALRRLAIDDEVSDMRILESEVNELIEDFASLDVSEANMAEMGGRLQKIIYDHRLRVPGGIFLILRALTILEGIGKVISPKFNTMEFLKPYGAKLLAERLNPLKIARDGFYETSELVDVFKAMPGEVREVVKQTRKGRLKLQIEHVAYEPALEKVTRTINRLALTLIIAALFIASSIALFATHLPTNSQGMPYVSVIGYLAALILCFVLWWVSVRSAKN